MDTFTIDGDMVIEKPSCMNLFFRKHSPINSLKRDSLIIDEQFIQSDNMKMLFSRMIDSNERIIVFSNRKDSKDSKDSKDYEDQLFLVVVDRNNIIIKKYVILAIFDHINYNVFICHIHEIAKYDRLNHIIVMSKITNMIIEVEFQQGYQSLQSSEKKYPLYNLNNNALTKITIDSPGSLTSFLQNGNSEVYCIYFGHIGPTLMIKKYHGSQTFIHTIKITKDIAQIIRGHDSREFHDFNINDNLVPYISIDKYGTKSYYFEDYIDKYINPKTLFINDRKLSKTDAIVIYN
jgi:hypothetical protein